MDEKFEHYPSLIGIETFHGCSARCTFCHVDMWDRPKGHMSDEIFNSILMQLSTFKEKIHQTALFLNGEPLMDSKIEEKIVKCKLIGLPNVGITTNGFLMKKERAVKIIESDPDYVVFSFDTLDRNIYEAGRLRLKFDVVYENVINFIKLRNKVGSNVRIVLRYIDFDNDKSDFDGYRNHFRPLLREDLDEVSYTKLHSAAFIENKKDKIFQDSDKMTSCGSVYNKVSIQSDGNIVLCPHDFNSEYSFGHVIEDGLLESFNSPEFNKIRQIHTDGRRGCISKCKKCDEPELNITKDMYAKYTPSGKRFFANVYHGFDYDEERSKVL
jgi:radical SAM protein with 4Fe4S-binding SPASM domain